MKPHPITAKELRQAILFAALLYLAYKFMALVAGLILILSVSTIAALVLDPAIVWLEKKKIRREWSAAGMAILVLCVLGTAAAIVVAPASGEVKELVAAIPQQTEEAHRWIMGVLDRYPAIKEAIPDELPEISLTSLSSFSAFSGALIGGASKATAGIAGAIAGALLAFICMVYMMANPKSLIEGILKPMSPTVKQRAQTAGTRIATAVRAWALGVLVGMIFIFIITWIALALIGIKQAFLFALIAGILEAVPVLGPILSAIPPLVTALLQDTNTAIKVLIAFLIIQQVEGNLLIPLVMSRQLSLHPISVLFAVIAMGGLFGILGMFLATPAVVAAGVVYEEFYLKPRLNEHGVVASDESDLV